MSSDNNNNKNDDGDKEILSSTSSTGEETTTITTITTTTTMTEKEKEKSQNEVVDFSIANEFGDKENLSSISTGEETTTTATITEKEKENEKENEKSQNEVIDFSIVDELPPQNKESDDSSSINEKKINDGDDNDKKSKKKSSTKKEKPETVPLFQLFRFATLSDILFMFAGTIGALGNGIAIPIMSIIFSGFIQIFLDYNFAINTGKSADEAASKLEDDVKNYAFYFIALGCSIFVCAYLQMCFWIIAGERQTKVGIYNNGDDIFMIFF